MSALCSYLAGHIRCARHIDIASRRLLNPDNTRILACKIQVYHRIYRPLFSVRSYAVAMIPFSPKLLVFITFWRLTKAQFTNVTCRSQFTWVRIIRRFIRRMS